MVDCMTGLPYCQLRSTSNVDRHLLHTQKANGKFGLEFSIGQTRHHDSSAVGGSHRILDDLAHDLCRKDTSCLLVSFSGSEGRTAHRALPLSHLANCQHLVLQTCEQAVG